MKSVLNYFVRKAFGFKSTATAEDKTLFGHLLRIRQNIQGVYDWLYARCPADAWWLARRMPMTEAVTSADGHEVHIAKAWNSANLLAHLRLLDNRKISNGYADGTPANDGLPDGVSLARLLCDSTTQPTELIDDNVGWHWDKTFAMSSLRLAIVNCTSILNIDNTASLCENKDLEIHLPCLETSDLSNNSAPPLRAKRMYFEGYKKGQFRVAGSSSWNNSITEYLYIGCKGDRGDLIRFWSYDDGKTFKNHAPNLVDVEIREGARQPLNFHGLTSITADNIVSHIFDRLADNNYEDDGVTKADPITITLGATNLAKLTDEQIAIATSKNYTLV